MIVQAPSLVRPRLSKAVLFLGVALLPSCISVLGRTAHSDELSAEARASLVGRLCDSSAADVVDVLRELEALGAAGADVASDAVLARPDLADAVLVWLGRKSPEVAAGATLWLWSVRADPGLESRARSLIELTRPWMDRALEESLRRVHDVRVLEAALRSLLAGYERGEATLSGIALIASDAGRGGRGNSARDGARRTRLLTVAIEGLRGSPHDLIRMVLLAARATEARFVIDAMRELRRADAAIPPVDVAMALRASDPHDPARLGALGLAAAFAASEPGIEEKLHRALTSGTPSERRVVAGSLAYAPSCDRTTDRLFVVALGAGDDGLRDETLWALERRESVVPQVAAALVAFAEQGPDRTTRAIAARVLGRSREADGRVLRALRLAGGDVDPLVRGSATAALLRLCPRDAETLRAAATWMSSGGVGHGVLDEIETFPPHVRGELASAVKSVLVPDGATPPETVLLFLHSVGASAPELRTYFSSELSSSDQRIRRMAERVVGDLQRR